MARIAKSLGIPEQGYAHRDHRSKKKHWRDKVKILKLKQFKEKIQERNERELQVQEVKEHFRKKHYD